MKFILITIFLLFSTLTNLYSQDLYSDHNLEEIYKRMTYRTPAFSEVQEKWKITDLDLIRDIFNKLYNNNALKRVNDNSALDDFVMKDYAKKIQDNLISIFCVRRYYDDQLDSLKFLMPKGSELEPLSDWLEMERELSKETYERIKRKDYSFIDFTNQDFVEPNNDTYSLFSLFHSEIYLISFGSQSKDVISPYYQMGYDNINLPSWYRGSVNYGLKFKLIPDDRPNNLNYTKFSLTIGIESPQFFSVSNDAKGVMATMFRNRKLFSATDNIFIGLSYSPLKDSWANLGTKNEKDFTQWDIELSLPFNKKTKEDLSLGPIDNFYSIQNHWSLNHSWHNIWDWADFGISYSGFNLAQYSTTSQTIELSRLSFRTHTLFSLEPGISREDPPFYYSFSPQLNFDFTNGQKFFVIKSQILFFRAFGIELKFFKSLNGKNTAPWHYQDYLVISPIIMIN